jgi:hypothetical protein
VAAYDRTVKDSCRCRKLAVPIALDNGPEMACAFVCIGAGSLAPPAAGGEVRA